VLRACSAAPIQFVTRRHQTTQESADTRTGRHRLTLQNIDQHKSSGLLIRGFGVRVPGGALLIMALTWGTPRIGAFFASIVDAGVLVVCSGAVGQIRALADKVGRDTTDAPDVRSSWPFRSSWPNASCPVGSPDCREACRSTPGWMESSLGPDTLNILRKRWVDDSPLPLHL
jgi:hypothetical protein